MHATRAIRRSVLTSFLLGLAVSAGCATKGQSGALIGSGIGALAGAAIGGNATGALIGAGVGTGIGYIVGNEADKADAQKMSDQTRSSNYQHSETGQLAGTTWKVTRFTPSDVHGDWTSIVVEFKRNGHVVTTTTRPNGDVDVDDEVYRVVGRTLIINDPGYMINWRFRVEGRTLYADVHSDKEGDYSMVMERV